MNASVNDIAECYAAIKKHTSTDLSVYQMDEKAREYRLVHSVKDLEVVDVHHGSAMGGATVYGFELETAKKDYKIVFTYSIAPRRDTTGAFVMIKQYATGLEWSYRTDEGYRIVLSVCDERSRRYARTEIARNLAPTFYEGAPPVSPQAFYKKG